MSRRSIVRSIAALAAAFAVVAGLTTVGAGANLKGAYTSVGFSPGISGVEVEYEDLTDVLRLYTQLDGRAAAGAERIVFVYGIGHGTEVSAPVVSETVILTRGAEPFIAAGSGPIDTPWDAFFDPLEGFFDPLEGVQDPLVGFFDPLEGFFDPLEGFEDPAQALEAIWGTGNIGIDPGDYGLVLFTMRHPASNSGGSIQFSSAIVPFDVREAT